MSKKQLYLLSLLAAFLLGYYADTLWSRAKYMGMKFSVAMTHATGSASP